MNEPAFEVAGVTVYQGDCREVLANLGECSVDAVICDPPYELAFMGRSWDAAGVAFDPDTWRAALRVLKPGGHLAAFGGTRTFHRVACAIEDAGFEIRDNLAAWVYSQGFAKSLDVSKAIDKAAGADREVHLVPTRTGNAVRRGDGEQGATFGDSHGGFRDDSAPATDAARQWQGWGTALSPAHEPIILARRPLAGTVAQTVLAHGTGGLNIDATRTGRGSGEPPPEYQPNKKNAVYGNGMGGGAWANTSGRWPKNALFAHHPDCGPDDDPGPCAPGCHVAALDAQTGTLTSGLYKPEHADRGKNVGTYGAMTGRDRATATYGDSGGASRFFPTFRYEAKASSAERPMVGGVAHPTVKPVALMAWLVRLLTPPGGIVLDPFAGSGATGLAAAMQNHPAVLVELGADHLPLIEARLRRRPREHRPDTPARRPAADGQGDLFAAFDEEAS